MGVDGEGRIGIGVVHVIRKVDTLGRRLGCAVGTVG
jgi:hypothetical protein